MRGAWFRRVELAQPLVPKIETQVHQDQQAAPGRPGAVQSVRTQRDGA